MVTRLKLAAFVLAIAIASTIGTWASAQAGRPVVELVGERGTLDRSKLEELIALELGSEASRVTRVTVDVRAGRASVDVALAAEHRKASVVLASVEPERALALFVGELARGAAAPAPPPAPTVVPAPPASVPGPPAPPASTAAPAPPTPPSTPAPTVAPSATMPASSASLADRALPGPAPSRAAKPWRFSLLGTMGVRVMTTDGARVATPRVEIGARQNDGLRLGATVRYGYASADDPLGTVQAHALAGGVAATYVLLSGTTIALATGPRAELGVVAGSGEGSNSASTTAPTFSGAWDLELHARLAPVALLVALEAGTFFRGLELRADQRDVLQLSGPFAGLALGAMF